MNNNLFVILMAGGVGVRFWPYSRNSKPKQFLDVLGTGKTLLQSTFDRFLPVCPAENIYVVTHEEHAELVKQQLPQLHALESKLLKQQPVASALTTDETSDDASTTSIMSFARFMARYVLQTRIAVHSLLTSYIAVASKSKLQMSPSPCWSQTNY